MPLKFRIIDPACYWSQISLPPTNFSLINPQFSLRLSLTILASTHPRRTRTDSPQQSMICCSTHTIWLSPCRLPLNLPLCFIFSVERNGHRRHLVHYAHPWPSCNFCPTLSSSIIFSHYTRRWHPDLSPTYYQTCPFLPRFRGSSTHPYQRQAKLKPPQTPQRVRFAHGSAPPRTHVTPFGIALWWLSASPRRKYLTL